MDYYEILELPRGATENEIKKAYVLGVAFACIRLNWRLISWAMIA